MNRCLDNHGSPPQIELVFVYRPVISRGIDPFKDVEWTKPKFKTTKHLDSPWAKITLDESPQVKMQAVFIWNERQFLHDEASILAGHALDTKPLMPIDLKTFDRWQDESDSAPPSKEAMLLAQLPADMQWLFKHVRITDKCISEGEVRCGLKTIMEEREKPGYTELSKAMIRKFFASKQNEIRYENVFALKDTFDISQYHIDKYRKKRIK